MVLDFCSRVRVGIVAIGGSDAPLPSPLLVRRPMINILLTSFSSILIITVSLIKMSLDTLGLFNVKGRVALVTGGSSGIGLMISRVRTLYLNEQTQLTAWDVVGPCIKRGKSISSRSPQRPHIRNRPRAERIRSRRGKRRRVSKHSHRINTS